MVRRREDGATTKIMSRPSQKSPERGLSQILELEEIRIIDFDNVKASFTGVNQTRVKRVIEGLSGKYNNKEHYGIVVISKYRNKNPYKAVNAMVFRMSDWKIIALGDN